MSVKFCNRLKSARANKGISQKKLAECLFVSQQTVAKWETDKATPNPETITKISNVLDVSTDYLLGVSDERNSSLDSDDIGYDDFTYAMHNESKELTDEDKEMLLDMARMLKKRINERKSKE